MSLELICTCPSCSASLQFVDAGKVRLASPAAAGPVVVPPPRRRSQPVRPLNQRQRAIARLVAQGLANKEIAHELGIAEPTVKNALHEAFRRIGVTERVSLALWVIHQGLTA